MLQQYFWFGLCFCAVLSSCCIDARVHGTIRTDQDHVHIKLHMPEVLRKQTHHRIQRHPDPVAPQQTFIRSHYGKRKPAVTRPTKQTIYAPYDFELLTQVQQHQHPPPIPILDTDEELMANFGPALFDNDISISSSTHRQQPQLHYPAMLAQPPLHSATPDTFSPTLLDFSDTGNNVLSTDDFLRELQQLYAHKLTVIPPVLTQTQQPQAERLTQVKKPAHKKRKIPHHHNNNNNNNSYKANGLPASPKPYYANQAYNNFYYSNSNKNYAKNHKYSSFLSDPTIVAQDVSDEFVANVNDDVDDDDGDDDEEDTNSGDTVSNDNTAMAFSAPIQADEDESIERDSFTGGFSPLSYQNMYATYAATPATKQLSTLPTRLHYKRQQPTLATTTQQQQQQEQFLPLSSIIPYTVSSGLTADHKAVRNTIRAPTIGTPTITTTRTTSHAYNESRKKRKNRIKAKRNRLMVQENAHFN